MDNPFNSGNSAAQNSVRFGIWGMKKVVRGLWNIFVQIRRELFSSKGVTFAGITPKAKDEKILKQIAWWGVRRKQTLHPAKWNVMGIVSYIRTDLLPILDDFKIPIEQRSIKDRDTWDHIKSVLDLYMIPYVLI